MSWVEVFAVFVVSHMVGDYMLQTEWQALNKRGGLSGPATARRALLSHISSYTLAFVPGLIWIWSSDHGWVFALAAVIGVPHMIQDDGRLLTAYARRFKKADIQADALLGHALDQSFHVLALFLTALLARAVA
ncbi:MAG: DUF3307 domain-containing protein [Solirubrobacteraceae bacterium]|jgi:hypothetical protein